MNCCKAILVEDLPPHAKKTVSVMISGVKLESQWGVLEPPWAASRALDDLIMGRTLVNLHQEQVPLRLMNLSRS